MAGKIVELGANLKNKSYTCKTISIVCGRQGVNYLHGRCRGDVGGGDAGGRRLLLKSNGERRPALNFKRQYHFI